MRDRSLTVYIVMIIHALNLMTACQVIETPTGGPPSPTLSPEPSLTSSPFLTSTRHNQDVRATARADYLLTPTPEITYDPYPYLVLVHDPLLYHTHPDDGCAWSGIAGGVYDQQGAAAGKGLLVSVIGSNFEQFAVTGAAPFFGPSGYGIQVANMPIGAEFVVQLFNTTGNPYSEPAFVQTLDDCNANVTLVDFVLRRP